MSEPEKFDPAELLKGIVPSAEVPEPDLSICGCPRIERVRRDEPVNPAIELCDDRWHWQSDGDAVVRRCPRAVKTEVRLRIASEAARLAGELKRLTNDFNPKHKNLRSRCVITGKEAWCDGSVALESMRRFAQGPHGNVLMKGPSGVGKTHLLLRSHLGLLKRGVASHYVVTPELRRLFRLAESFNEEAAEEARGKLDKFVYAAAVHFDDAGHVENDQRARGQFAEGLKALLDRSRAKWAVSTNRSAAEAEQHPDLTAAVMSRLLAGCEVIEIDGDDYRNPASHAKEQRA